MHQRCSSLQPEFKAWLLPTNYLLYTTFLGRYAGLSVIPCTQTDCIWQLAYLLMAHGCPVNAGDLFGGVQLGNHWPGLPDHLLLDRAGASPVQTFNIGKCLLGTFLFLCAHRPFAVCMKWISFCFFWRLRRPLNSGLVYSDFLAKPVKMWNFWSCHVPNQEAFKIVPPWQWCIYRVSWRSS